MPSPSPERLLSRGVCAVPSPKRRPQGVEFPLSGHFSLPPRRVSWYNTGIRPALRARRKAPGHLRRKCPIPVLHHSQSRFSGFGRRSRQGRRESRLQLWYNGISFRAALRRRPRR